MRRFCIIPFAVARPLKVTHKNSRLRNRTRFWTNLKWINPIKYFFFLENHPRGGHLSPILVHNSPRKDLFARISNMGLECWFDQRPRPTRWKRPAIFGWIWECFPRQMMLFSWFTQVTLSGLSKILSVADCYTEFGQHNLGHTSFIILHSF